MCLVLLLVPLCAVAGDLGASLPESVGPLERISLLTGAEAQAAVDALHGKALTAEASAVARYGVPGSGDRPAEVWVSQVSSTGEARRQTGLMVHRMYENPNSPFSHPRRIEHEGVAVYRFEGMGRAHLIWATRDRVYWISTPFAHETAFLDAVCAAP